MGKKQKVVLPPDLPPEVPEEDVQFSDEDVEFVAANQAYAALISNLDSKSIDKHVIRVADVKEDALESLYEKRRKKKDIDNASKGNLIEVDPVDALPVKTEDGKLYYKTIPKSAPKPEGEVDEAGEDDWSVGKLTKAEKRAKLKKSRKEAKKQANDGTDAEEVKLISQAEVLDEVKKDLSAEETREKKKYRLAELGTDLLAEPESNIRSLREMLDISKEGDYEVVVLALKSLLAVFRDIIPGYRIRLPTEKEMEMKVSKIVKKMRLFESTLLSAYKAYVQKLIALEEQPVYKRVAVRCLSTLLEAVPHFNFRHEVLAAVVRNISSQDDVLRKCCCAAVKYIFTNEGKHGGEATLEAVQLIANLVKSHDCQLHPDAIEVLLSLVFDEDLGKSEKAEADNQHKNKKFKKGKNIEEKNKLTNNERKRSRQEEVSKTREEVEADFRSASLGKDVAESRKIQSDTLAAVFQILFRVLRHTLQTSSLQGASDSHPLLASSLKGIGKFSHLIDLDFMSDLMNYLRKLAAGANSSGSENSSKQLTVTERLQCCIVAFKVMKSNLDALNIDLQDFYVHLYNLILEYRPGRDQGEVLAEALKIMLCDERQHDMQRAASFIKRLATFSLCFGSAESMAALATVKNLLQKNVKCRNLLENDVGGGSVSGAIAKYQPYSSDPHISGALASVLWELNLLSKHYHPSVSTIASNISTMSAANNQVSVTVSPEQAFAALSLEQELSKRANDSTMSAAKKKKSSKSGMPSTFKVNSDVVDQIDANEVKKKLSEHFVVLLDISENEKLRAELEVTSRSLQLYEQYKKHKKRKTKAIM